jgi:sulfur-oxidizing protein SoxZ
MAARVVVNVPPRARRGEVLEIRTLAEHPMESGFRRTQLGELVPRDIVTRLTCTYNGVEIFRVDVHPAMAVNPLIAFTTVATESGELVFRWEGDHGYTASHTARIEVD